jgi:hypothetical protein
MSLDQHTVESSGEESASQRLFSQFQAMVWVTENMRGSDLLRDFTTEVCQAVIRKFTDICTSKWPRGTILKSRSHFHSFKSRSLEQRARANALNSCGHVTDGDFTLISMSFKIDARQGPQVEFLRCTNHFCEFESLCLQRRACANELFSCNHAAGFSSKKWARQISPEDDLGREIWDEENDPWLS